MNFSHALSLSTPTKVLFAFTFLHQFVLVTYAGLAIEPMPVFEALGWVASLWILCWWLINDSQQTGTTWPMDMGYFLAVAAFVVIPYHLLKTRGLKNAVTGILAYLAIFLAGWLTAVLVLLILY